MSCGVRLPRGSQGAGGAPIALRKTRKDTRHRQVHITSSSSTHIELLFVPTIAMSTLEQAPSHVCKHDLDGHQHQRHLCLQSVSRAHVIAIGVLSYTQNVIFSAGFVT